MNTNSCAIASQPKSAGLIERAGFTDLFVTGMLARWMRDQGEVDRQRREPLGCAGVGHPEDEEQEDSGEHDLDDQPGKRE